MCESMKWISVKDELPKGGEIVLAYGVGKRPSMSLFNATFKRFERYVDVVPEDFHVAHIEYDKITHWMPLPPKP